MSTIVTLIGFSPEKMMTHINNVNIGLKKAKKEKNKEEIIYYESLMVLIKFRMAEFTNLDDLDAATKDIRQDFEEAKRKILIFEYKHPDKEYDMMYGTCDNNWSY